MDFILRSVRYFVMIFSAVLAAGAFFVVRAGAPFEINQFIRLEEFYAFTALTFLYVALLATPLAQAVPDLPVSFRALYIKARRALGVSAFFFGLLHGSIAFSVLLGGFGGLWYLPSKYLLAASLGFAGLLILALLAATSFDFAVRALGKKWKILHRLVYAAAIFILLHAVLLGSHLSNRASPVTQILFVAVLFLLALEALRIYKFLRLKFAGVSARALACAVWLGLIAGAMALYIALNGLSLHLH